MIRRGFVNRYKYLIVGGGMAADAAVHGIREVDKEGSIGILSKDSDPPYRRPPLSKDLWKGEMRIEEVDCGTADCDVDILTGRTVQKLNIDQKTVTDQNGVYSYEKLLLATGGRPKPLPFEPIDRAVFFRSLNDFRTVLDQTGESDCFAVIGGGFIGCEMAAALAMKGKKVTMIFPEKAPGSRVFPEKISSALAEYYKGKGVEILSGLKTSNMVCGET
jgi:NADPH-dependent 2,4-dienoyl-CoA reductase/sulfur reductase-like enzyme